MSKAFVTYELIALWDEIIFSRFDVDDAMMYHAMLLDICGWTEAEYEKELLSRIDEDWETSDREISCLSN